LNRVFLSTDAGEDSYGLTDDWLALIAEGEEEISKREMVQNKKREVGIEKRSTNPEESGIATMVSETQSLLATASTFLTQLSKTLSNKNSGEHLVRSLVHLDQTDGKTYLKIPVESENTIYSMFELFARVPLKKP